jgi:hypothetical protein
MLREGGAARVGALAWNKAASASEFTMSAVKERLLGEANVWFSRHTLNR